MIKPIYELSTTYESRLPWVDVEVIDIPSTVMEDERYSYMFEHRDRSKTGGVIYPIAFGWGCGKGWYKLIAELVHNISLIDKDKEIRVDQIKEKFGGLRFYINAGSDEIYALIDKYEEKCWATCEGCGEPATHTTKGWITRLCEKCFNKNNTGAHIYDDIKH